MNAVDLFAGCGGLSKGFIDAGYQVLLGVDNDEAALKTFALNHPGATPVNADLSDEDELERLIGLASEQSVDVVIAGPPCQGFSLTGPRHFDDDRNRLYLAVFRMVKALRPKALVIENVPGMSTLYNGQIQAEILRRFRKLGYHIDSKILCAADFGVPQMRKRLVFIGIREDIGPVSFPAELVTPEHYVTCREAISDLPSRAEEIGEEVDVYTHDPITDYQKKMRANNTVLYNHVATRHTKMVQDTIALVPEGGNYKDLPRGVGESRKFHEAWTRYDGNKPSRTIDTGHRNHFHYEYNRVPTVRENARLQSFPDSFVFCGTRTQQNRQVGNAVPPLLGYAIARHLRTLIGEKDHEQKNPDD
ncbi:MAG: DNA cytosine methyltransferase [Lachnospiraceae bacterium]